MTTQTSTRRLTRARTGTVFGGVCAGLARYLGWKPWLVRSLFVLSCLLPGPQVLIYLAMWIFVPKSAV
ncbi:PspC domain-containing protein [Rhodococcus sp. NPDC058514]|uniref:PspC domain-containing protein n=1 Tax=unclassified Rhodococcus (in: high G+C Gram-positive bacteria) TaxID=192944 RepID=UPI00364A1B98